MTPYPVTLRIARPAQFTRVQLLARVLAFCALGVLGISFGAIFLFGYLALPVYAAVRSEETPRTDDKLVRALHWLAAICAWTGLVAERLPVHDPRETVDLAIAPAAAPRPTAGAALWRVIAGLPSALVLAVLGWIGTFVWLWAALSVLFVERVGPHAFHYLVGLQRWSVRLLAFQGSLVDEYPPFSFAESDAPALPPARAIS